MLKKVFSTLLMATMILFIANNPAFAQSKVVVIFDFPTGTFSEPEKVYSLVETSLENILGNMERDMVPISETENYVQVYREENNMISSTGAEEGDVTVFYLKKDDLNNICGHFGGDHIVYVRLTNTAPKVSVGFFSASQKTNVVLDFRVWSNNTKDFTYMKRATATGSSTAIYAGVGSSSRALEKGLKKNLQEIEKDADKIREAMAE